MLEAAIAKAMMQLKEKKIMQAYITLYESVEKLHKEGPSGVNEET